MSIEGAAAAAAKWWADKFGGHFDLNNGDTDPKRVSMLDMLHSRRSMPTPEQVGAFCAYLGAYLLRAMRGEEIPQGYGYWRTSLEVDYDPCGILGDAIAASGFPGRGYPLPVKTTMRFNAQTVIVSEGRGTDYVEIYSDPSAQIDASRTGRLQNPNL